jgi:hypothetical protein
MTPAKIQGYSAQAMSVIAICQEKAKLKMKTLVW